MEQKTEASQAVDDRQSFMEALSMCIDALDRESDWLDREKAQANAVRVLGGAALKAQPAPTEARGEPVAWFEAEPSAKGWPLRDVIGGMIHSTRWHTTKPEVLNNALWPLYEHPANTANNSSSSAQGEDGARLVDILDEIMQSIPRNVGRWAGGNAPGHCHAVAGIWDPDNGAKAGLKCGWCDVWRRADEEVRKFRARASAETGGVKL